MRWIVRFGVSMPEPAGGDLVIAEAASGEYAVTCRVPGVSAGEAREKRRASKSVNFTRTTSTTPW